MDFSWDRIASSASQPGMWLAPTSDDSAIAARHPALADDHGLGFSATFNPAQAEGRWFLQHATQVKNIWVPYGE